MLWFGSFVNDTVRQYRRSENEKKASLIEEVEEYLKEAQVSRTFGGRLGEILVEKKLEARGYEAKRTIGSTSPGDVWGLRMVDDKLLHLPIIQVKNSTVGQEPQSLTRREEQELLNFTAFVFRAFQQSQRVPQDAKDQRLVVSAGYVGISMQGIDFDQAIWRGQYFGAFGHPSLNNEWERHEPWLEQLHSLT